MMDIIILAHDQHEMTADCLEAVRQNTMAPHRIVLVDNGSVPPYEGATIRNERNLGYPVAVNAAIRQTTGDVICLLNNDVYVTPGWDRRLLEGLEQFDIVGPMTSYAAGVQLTTVGHYENLDGLNARALEYAEENRGRTKEVNWVTGFCFMFKRSLWNEIGEFDESMWPCNGEEIDFCMRARKAGKRIGIIQDVYVHHDGSKTFTSMNLEYDAIVERNDKYLASKWGDTVWLDQCILSNGDGLRLNLGCGPFKLKHFKNIDINKDLKPDIVADITDLPFEPGTVDEIYAGHVLEHFDWRDGERALGHWVSMLRPGGKISVSVPDYDMLCRTYLAHPTAERLREFNDRYIYSYIQKSPHKYAYNEALLEDVMMRVGLVSLKRMPVDHEYFPHAVDWQVGIEGRKRISCG